MFMPDYTPKPIATRTAVDGRKVYLWWVCAALQRPFKRFSFSCKEPWPKLPPLADLIGDGSDSMAIMEGVALHAEQVAYSIEHGGLE